MIKENINITFTGGETIFEGEGQIIVPSQVITSTPQDEQVDLEKAPNVLIKLKDEAARGVRSLSSEYKKINAEFELGDKTYTMKVSLIDSTQDYAVLQYCDGLTSEEATHTFECVNHEIETHYNLGTGDVEGMDTHFLYDGIDVRAEEISLEPMNYHTITVGEPTPEDITLTPKTVFPEIGTGEFVDTLTATYKGITTTVTVTLTITETSADYITFETSQGTFVVWDSNGGNVDTVIYAPEDLLDAGSTIKGTFRYYVQGQEYCDPANIQSSIAFPYNDLGIRNEVAWPEDDGIYNVTGDIGYRTSDGETWVKITDSLTINVQRTVTPVAE